MPDNNEPEQKVREKKKPQQPSALERLADEGNQALKGITNIGIGTAAIGAATYLYNIGGLITAGAFTAARKIGNDLRGVETKIKDLRDASIVGA